MSRHLGPPGPSHDERGPEPSYAERARTLVHLGRTGTLATVSRRHPGHPFASLMPYATDAPGHPLFLISSLAMHTQNLAGDRRASLLVTEPGVTGDPLAAGRVTLMGEVTRVRGDDVDPVRAAYLERHPNAASWVDYEDFAFYRLTVSDVYFVGGFGAMDWVTAATYGEAGPDPLAEAAPGILEHMNRDHPDALLTFARVLAGAEADEATMVAVDRLGFRLRVRSGGQLSGARIPFSREVRTPDDTRVVLIEMLRAARARAAGGAGPATS